MKYNIKKTVILMAACSLVTPCFATNYDDGIAPEGPIQDNIEKDSNINYIIQKATASSKSGSDKVITADDGNAGIGNIIIGPGADLNGITIINQSDNDGAAVISK